MHPRIKNILENYTYPIIKSITYPNGDNACFRRTMD